VGCVGGGGGGPLDAGVRNSKASRVLAPLRLSTLSSCKLIPHATHLPLPVSIPISIPLYHEALHCREDPLPTGPMSQPKALSPVNQGRDALLPAASEVLILGFQLRVLRHVLEMARVAAGDVRAECVFEVAPA
jgi:hypothetical protein